MCILFQLFRCPLWVFFRLMEAAKKNAFINHCCFGCLSQKRRFLWRLPYPVFVLLSDQFDHLKLIFLGSPSAHSLKKNQGKQDKVGIFPSREGGQLFPHLPAIIPQKKWIFFLCLGKIPTFSHFFVSDVPYLAFSRQVRFYSSSHSGRQAGDSP